MFSRAVTIPVTAHTRRLQRNSYLAIMVSLILLASTYSDRVWAQTSTTGEITGVVTDPAGAVVPNISVTLKNTETGTITVATTNLQGVYTFSLLQPSSYTVSATATGFQAVRKTVTAALGSSVTGNIALVIESAQQTVEVTSEGIGVQTEDANLETHFNARQISLLPNLGNDLSAVALTSPGWS